ncbi:hypothetical protein V8G54_023521 [Vigna mungo]|uniref:Uncharacterized protein n=1 Tax=Vigna mungo TaxID=3915 RepID=A0AAQ3N3A8_VIGMU
MGKSRGKLVQVLYPKVCNKQLDSWECDFYVMSWIKTIFRAVITDEWNEGSAFGGNLHPCCEKKENAARFASMEDDIRELCGSCCVRKHSWWLVEASSDVGEDYGPGALHDDNKDCRVDDEAVNLDDSWLMHENEDSNGIVTSIVVAMEVARDGCHGSLQDSVAIGFGGLKVEEDGDVAVVKCHLNIIVHTWIVCR